MKLYNGLIGNSHKSSEIYFTGSDTLDNLDKRLKKEDNNWYYRNVNITYRYNNHGHRCKNIEEIDLDNYILFAGCSHTEGVGLELEKTFPYLVSKNLNCDYYNLGIGGAGIDAVLHNVIIWLNTHKRPKALVMQWPIINRYCRVNGKGQENDGVLTSGPWMTDEDQINFLLAGNKIRYFESVQILAKKQIDSFDIPIIHVSPNYGYALPEGSIEFPHLDYARDLHFGIISHATIATTINKMIGCSTSVKIQ